MYPMNRLEFRYHPDLLNRFPNICGGVILVQGLNNAPTPPDLLQAYQTEQHAVLVKIGGQPLSEIPSLASWRAAFRLFGVDPTKYRSAAEALLRRLTKKGDIPSISALVDLCNLVSIRYGLPVAAFDVRALSGAVTVRFAAGDEAFTAHDAPEPEHPEPGEVIFADPAGLVVARRWCWKQSLESTVQLDTRDAILTVEAQHPGGQQDIQAALKDLSILLERFVGGNFKGGVLNKDQPGIY
jgi:DNA/RNA-binding domain of Phe-tRNA-synthetase-like protein